MNLKILKDLIRETLAASQNLLRRDYAFPARIFPHPEIIPILEIRKIGKVGHYSIIAVDGQIVRDYIDVDFTQGGNPARYAYVPQNEIWVEELLSPKDMAATIYHEIYETVLMRRGLSYNDAHDAAAAAESLFRKSERQVDSSSVVTVALKWLKKFPIS